MRRCRAGRVKGGGIILGKARGRQRRTCVGRISGRILRKSGGGSRRTATDA